MMTEEQRRFEQWVVGIYHTRLLKDEKGNYRGQVLQQLWQAWQAALTQPASPALKLPDGWLAVPRKLTREMAGIYHNEKCVYGSAQGLHDALLDAAAPVVPHTAPIEPICATGGAEWVKCSDRMPKALKSVVISGPFLGDMTGYWNVNHWEIEGAHWDKDDVTHWYEYPAAPEE